MKKKLFWLPTIAALLSIGILFAIGNIFEISFLDWYFYKENPSEGLTFETGGSFIPVIIGFFVGFITERTLKNKYKKDANF